MLSCGFFLFMTVALATISPSSTFSHCSVSHLVRISSSRASAQVCGVKMAQGDTFDRLGKLGNQAKEWVAETGKKDGINIRGAGVGAVAGGLIAGPLGAILGGMVGKNVGAQKAAEKEYAQRLGLTPEVVAQIQELESEVTATRADYEVVLEARNGLIARNASLTRDADEYYARARQFLEAGNEDGARTALTYRQKTVESLQSVAKELDESNFRCLQFKRAMTVMEDRLKDILELQRRCASATTTAQELFEIQDPLLEKFKKWEREM